MTIHLSTRMSGIALCIVLLYWLLPFRAQAEGAGWRQVSEGLEGGTIIDLAISPDFATDGLLFAVTDNGRVFRYVNGKWTPDYSVLANQAIRRVIFSPTFSTDSSLFAISDDDGVFASQDAGLTWTLLGVTGISFQALQASPNYAVDETIYAGGFKALYRMKADGSQSTQLAGGLLLTDTVLSLAFSPDFASDSTIFAGTKISGVVRSTDGGADWRYVGLAGLRVNALVMTPGNAVTPTLFAGTGAAGAGRGLYRSTDNGDTWELATNGLDDQVIEAIAVSPNYAVDGRLYAGTNFDDLYTSTNGGDSWTPIDDPLLPVGVKSIVLRPDFASNPTLFVGQSNDLGVVVSTNAGAQWETLNSGLFGLSVDDLFIWSNLAEQTALFAKAYPVGIYRSDDLGTSWQSSYGEGLPKASLVLALAVSPKYDSDKTLFLSLQSFGVYRSTDGGVNWQEFNDPTWPHDSTEAKQIAISPAFHRDETVFVGVAKRGIYRSTQSGSEWERVYEHADVNALAISPNYASDFTVFAAAGDTILRSNDGGDTWTPAQSGLANRSYEIIAVPPNFGPNGNKTLFAVYNQSRVLYRSTDGGVSWEALGDRFPTGSVVNALVFSPDFGPKDAKMYAGLAQGVYASEDAGDTWQPLTGGAPIWDVESLVISQGLVPKLYAGIEGGSVWQYDIDRPSPNLSCGAVIITGTVTLDRGLQCDGTALTVTAPLGATIDCAGYALEGNYPADANGVGIDVVGSTGVTITNCTTRNFMTGVRLQGSSGNVLMNNSLSANGIGVWMTSLVRAGGAQASTDNAVTSNLLTGNESGLVLDAGSDRNRLSGNTVQSSTGVDIKISGVSHTLITGNSIEGEGVLGISIHQSEFMTVTANSVLSRSVGTRVNGNEGFFTGNTWRNNGTGLEIEGTSSNNLFYNNLLNNGTNVALGSQVGANTWNVAKRNGPNVIGGASIGGNFWGGPNASGFSQSCPDAPSDGLCDTPYSLGNNNQDELPLAAVTGLSDCVSGPQWAVLVYLNGDNDLEFWTERLFNRLEQVADNPCLQIVVLWDDRSQSGGTNLYWVQGDSNPFVLAEYTEMVNLWPYGELDMGNPQTLINFVNWSRSAFPTPYTMLSIVGHGNGWSPSSTATPLGYFHTGISFDNSGDGSYLSTENVGTALGIITQDGADPIDLLYFDACLMAMAETFYPLRNFASYAVASENESFTSYPYDRYLSAVKITTTPADLANRIVVEHHQSLPGYPRTLAAFDLSRMAVVSSAIDTLANSLLDQNNQIPDAYQTRLQQAFTETQRLDANVDLLVDGRDGYVDLYHFAARVQSQLNDTIDVRNAAQAVQNALSGPTDPFITKSLAASGFYGGAMWDLENANGLSIYLPLGEPDWRQDFYNERELSFARDTLWDEFVRAMIRISPLGSDERPVNPSTRPGPLKVSVYSLYLPNLQR